MEVPMTTLPEDWLLLVRNKYEARKRIALLRSWSGIFSQLDTHIQFLSI
jgi:hypothetical protein